MLLRQTKERKEKTTRKDGIHGPTPKVNNISVVKVLSPYFLVFFASMQE